MNPSRTRTKLALALVAALGGCIIDTVPTPENGSDWNGGPPPNAVDMEVIGLTSVFYSIYPGASAILVAGTAGSVPGKGWVGIVNTRDGSWAQRQSRSDGSFSMSVNAAVADTLRLTYFESDVVLAEAMLEVRPSSRDAISASLELSGSASPSTGTPGVTATVPVGGLSTVAGVPGLLAPGITAVVVNPSGGVVSVPSGLDGAFAVQIAANHGDLLVIFAVETGVSQAGGPPATISVP